METMKRGEGRDNEREEKAKKEKRIPHVQQALVFTMAMIII